jgi:hypothetical protein
MIDWKDEDKRRRIDKINPFFPRAAAASPVASVRLPLPCVCDGMLGTKAPG